MAAVTFVQRVLEFLKGCGAGNWVDCSEASAAPAVMADTESAHHNRCCCCRQSFERLFCLHLLATSANVSRESGVWGELHVSNCMQHLQESTLDVYLLIPNLESTSTIVHLDACMSMGH